MGIISKLAKAFTTNAGSSNEDSCENSQTPAKRPPAEKKQTPAGTRKHQNRTRNHKKSAAKRPSNAGQNQPYVKEQKKHVEKVDPVGFKGFGLDSRILDGIAEQGYSNPTPIQKACIKDLMKGRDLLGCAQTGTGKTAAFALPTLQGLLPKPSTSGISILVLTPTRELALQVSESYKDYGKYLDLSIGVVFGGVGIEPQKRMLKKGVDVLVATPGRLLDLNQQGYLQLRELSVFILDEADRMLDMGFLPDVKRIVKLLPRKRQNVLFSATMPKDIEDLSMSILVDPVKVEVARVSSASERVEQLLYPVNTVNKRDLLLHILEDPSTYKVLVFTRTKAIANRISDFLVKHKISSAAIHGNKSQNARQRALDEFKGVKIRVLVATDLAARGLDVDDITHVINFDVPNIAETYIHRIGRTGRAQAVGKAFSFCDQQEQAYIRDIEKLVGRKIKRVEDHPFPFERDVDKPRVQRGSSGPRNKPSHRRGPAKPGSSRNSSTSAVRKPRPANKR